MKVVINTCYGGFTLSEKAVQMYVDRKELKFYTASKNGIILYYTIPVEEYEKELAEEIRMYNEKSKDYRGYISNRHRWNLHNIKRNDLILVKLVEELGDDANGEYAKLKVVEIPDDIEYIIEEYDGCEHIAEKHRTWY